MLLCTMDKVYRYHLLRVSFGYHRGHVHNFSHPPIICYTACIFSMYHLLSVCVPRCIDLIHTLSHQQLLFHKAGNHCMYHPPKVFI